MNFSERELLAAAKQIASAQRPAFLERVCGQDLEMRRRLEAELTSSESGLSSQATEIGADAGGILADEAEGAVIGRYKLLQKLGEGGFGAVWMAEQKEPVRRRVALKIIKLGMDTRQVVARFEAERQALALMDHPNIAKVFDAGVSESGRPFFVMELVQGISITQYCDLNHLSTEERLRLFIQICQAIQHAHQKGIIHRDIKPSNILVAMQDGKPVPKVIDFGIAKATRQALTDQTLFTQFQQFIGTPAYMSPEQAEMSGLDIDTRSDIYSLGVLLYELLTGRTPFDSKELLSAGLDEMRRVIREKEPVRPSTRVGSLIEEEVTTIAKQRRTDIPKLIRQLRGDLDWVGMKCLEKDRTRRYDTAVGLAMDLNRYLQREPVMARPPSAVYKLQKFASRNRMAVGAGALIALSLIAGLAVSAYQAVRAKRAEQGQFELRQAAEKAQQSEKLNRENAEKAKASAEAATMQARRNLYAADMLLAFQANEKGHLGRTRQLLSKYMPNDASRESSDPDLRGWEWFHLSDRARGEELYTLRGHSNVVTAALFLKDGRTIFSGGGDGTVRFWDALSRSNHLTIPYGDYTRCADLSSDGRFLAVGGWSKSWTIWDVSRRAILHSATNSGVIGVAFSPKGDLCALVEPEQLMLIGIPGFEVKRTLPRQGGRDFVSGVAFSPDGAQVAFCLGNRDIGLLDLATDSQSTLGSARLGQALSLAISPDGQHLAAGDRLGIQIWNLRTKSASHALTNHHEQVVALAFSPDGKLLASGSGDQTIKLYDVTNFVCAATFIGHEDEVHSLKFSADSRLLVSAGKDETIRVWDAQKRPAPWRSIIEEEGLIFTRSERIVFSKLRNLRLRVFDVLQLKEFEYALPASFPNGNRFQINPSGTTISVVEEAGAISLWNLAEGTQIGKVPPSTNHVADTVLSEDSKLLAVLRQTREVELWDLPQKKIIKILPPMFSTASDLGLDIVGFWASDRIFLRGKLAGWWSSTREIEAITIPDFDQFVLAHSHKGTLTAFVVDPQGKVLATSSYESAVKLIDFRTGREIASLGGQLVGFNSLAFSLDGARLAAGAWDGTITIWDLSTFHQVAHWKAHARFCKWVQFLGQDEYLASAAHDTLWKQTLADVALWKAPRRR